MENLNDISWPDAVVICVGILGTVTVICTFFIAINGSKFPWEK